MSDIELAVVAKDAKPLTPHFLHHRHYSAPYSTIQQYDTVLYRPIQGVWTMQVHCGYAVFCTLYTILHLYAIGTL